MLALGRRLSALGYSLAQEPGDAGTIVCNTCAVTQEAERKSRQLLRRLRRDNPGARIVAVGCYSELGSGVGGEFQAGDLLLGSELKRALLARPQDFLTAAEPDTAPVVAARAKTRALLRIQEGCDNRCTYCMVWRLRGPQRSRPAGEVLAEARELLADGYREIVLTGVHIGAYGRDLSGSSELSALIEALLAETRLSRLRLSSIEPWDLAALDVSLWQNERLCPHLHVPLQSGSDTVLERMGRRYDTEEYMGLAEHLYAHIPDLAVTTDLIVGFPGESEDEFEASLAFVRRCGFARLHVFPYSPRPGTVAASLAGQVPLPTRRERAQRMRKLAGELAFRFEERFVGRTLPVLWEQRRGSQWSGLTPNYLRVFCESECDLRNREGETHIAGRGERGLTGKLLSAI